MIPNLSSYSLHQNIRPISRPQSDPNLHEKNAAKRKERERSVASRQLWRPLRTFPVQPAACELSTLQQSPSTHGSTSPFHALTGKSFQSCGYKRNKPILLRLLNHFHFFFHLILFIHKRNPSANQNIQYLITMIKL